MQVDALEIPDLKLITPVKHSDERGFFSEIYSQRDMEAAGLNPSFLQENCSFSAPKYTVRGLHWQSPPTAQAKLIQVTQGAILDVAVDVRLNSPWFGRHVAVELSADNWQQLLVPAGFAHGFCTLEEDTTVLYKVDAYYSAADDHGLRWNDPTLGIDWPVSADAAILSGKDKNLPMLADCDLPFIYTETQS